MTGTKSTHITWHSGHVSRADRERKLAQKGVTVWLTGLSGSGKSTIAVAAEYELLKRGHLAYVLDGDNVRHGLNKNLDEIPRLHERAHRVAVSAVRRDERGGDSGIHRHLRAL